MLHSSSSKKLYALMGPTASGKTNLSIELAKKLNAEIISVDSTLVYKRLNVGSAKPTFSEMDGIIHHLIDIVEPWSNYSVNDFLHNSKKLISDIHSRNKEVLFVGGTMMYFHALYEGISRLPKISNEVKEKFESHSISYWYNFLKRKDPKISSKINFNDQYRVRRAVEIILTTTQPYSLFIEKNNRQGGLGPLLYFCALIPNDRKILHELIEKRFFRMITLGFIEEVHELKKLNTMSPNLSSMRSVGYRQAWKYLDGEYSYIEFVNKTLAATRQLAKRQLTWIRNWKKPIPLVNSNQNFKIKLDEVLLYFT